MDKIATENPDVVILAPRIFSDRRGFFFEAYHAERYRSHRLPERFVQDNLSHSGRAVLRGLHYQIGKPQGKLIMVTAGEIFDVAVDIRRSSPHFGKWVGTVLSSENCRQIYIPEGFAHGFCVLGEQAVVLYKCTDYYSPENERGIRYDDPLLAIDWPVTAPILSEKDCMYPTLSELSLQELPP